MEKEMTREQIAYDSKDLFAGGWRASDRRHRRGRKPRHHLKGESTMAEKTVAIAVESVKGSGDEFTHVMGVGISLQAAVDEYRRYWEHQEKSDKDRTSYSYVAVVPVPADPPEDGDELYWYDEKIVLPCLWENTIIDSVDAVKDGKWIA